MKQLKKNLALYICMFIAVFCAMTLRTEAANVRTGTLGDNDGITWTYDEDTKTLTITGEDSGLEGKYDNTKYNIVSPFAYICEDVEIIKVQNCTLKGSAYSMFVNLKSLKSVEFTNVDTSNVTSMSRMFSNCSSLTSLDLSEFETSNVTGMNEMFRYCSNLKSLDVSSFDTSNVRSMESMFEYCENLSSLDLRNFNTSNVVNMRWMFADCKSLISLDVSSFNTSNVTNMYHMFNSCKSLSSLDVSKFDISNAKEIQGMFAGCNSLTYLDVSGFDTSGITNMSGLFSGCSSLTSLDVSNFDTSNVTNMYSLFIGCSSLTSLDVSNFNTSNVTDMENMFSDCSSLISLDLSSFNTSNVNDMYSMFLGCSSLSSLDLSSFNTSNVENMENMFHSCSSLGNLDVSSFNTSKVKSMSWMFYNCSSLSSLDLSSFELTNVQNVSDMLIGCDHMACIKTSQTMPKSGSAISLPGTYVNSEGQQTKYITKDFCNTTLINVDYLVSEIKIEPSNINVNVGETAQLTATIFPEDAFNKTLTWKSSDTAVATVDANGKVKAVAPGTATITATATDGSGKSVTCEVTVTRAMSEQEKQIRAFVERMYTVALGRASDSDGLDFYTEKLLSGDFDGASVAQCFLCSPEFLNKGYDDAQYVKVLYKTFFDREPATEEVNFWVGQINSGKTRMFVLAGFVNSVEFDDLCASYGISRGYMCEDGTPINPGIGRFAERLYTVVLERAGEKEGIEFWSLSIANGVCTPKDAAKKFFLSEEYINKNTSDTKYITTLYKAFMDREPEAGGVEFWQGVLNDGATREQILEGFADSEEFKGIMASFGLQ